MINNPKKTNGYVIFDAPSDLGYCTAVIYERTFTSAGIADVPVKRETFTGINSFYIPREYQSEGGSKEYVYQVLVYNTSNQLVYDTGVKPTTGDNSPMDLRKSWLCDGIDNAYKIKAFTLPGASSGILEVTGADYVYEFIRPQDIPQASNGYNNYSAFLQQHNLTPPITDYLAPSSPNPCIISLQNDYLSYKDRNNMLIGLEAPIVYAVQKTNWKWNCGIDTNSIDLSSVLAPNTEIQYPIWDINNYSNIGTFCTNYAVLECTSWSNPDDGNLPDSFTSPYGQLVDCLMNMSYNQTDPTLESASIPELVNQILGCFDANSLSNLIDLEVVDISDLKDPQTVVSYDKADFLDSEGNFCFPPFNLEKGMYWVKIAFDNGRFTHFFKRVNQRTWNAAADKDYVFLTVFPVPIQSNSFSLRVQSSVNTNFQYEVLTSGGASILETIIRVSPGDDFVLPVDITDGIPRGSVFHKFTFADGSTETIHTIK